MQGQGLCGHCSTSLADLFCAQCEVMVCSGCLEKHQARCQSTAFHGMAAWEFRRVQGYYEEVAEKRQKLTRARDKLSQNLAEISEFISKIKQREQVLIKQISDASSQLIFELLAFKDFFTSEVEQGLAELEQQLYMPYPCCRSYVGRAVLCPEEEWQIFKYRMSERKVGKKDLGSFWKEERAVMLPSLVKNNQIYRFDVHRSSWLSSTLPHSVSLGDRSTLIPLTPHKLFACGGDTLTHDHPRTPHLVSSTYIFTLSSSTSESVRKVQVVQVQDMLEGGFCRGGVYVEERQGVYAFGGTKDGKVAERRAEVFELRRGMWRAIGRMMEARMSFNPSYFRGLIYLCGGFHDSIEYFSPETEQFTLWISLPHLPPYQDTASLFLPFTNTLLLISHKQITSYASDGTAVTIPLHRELIPWSRSVPVAWGRSVFITRLGFETDRFKGCYQIDIETGEVTSHPLPWSPQPQ